MSHIFISYSRKDINFAQKIVDALAANNLDTWIDWKSIPKGEDWEQEIYRGIEEADVFLFLISPDSVTSQMCNKEIACAVKNGKRILPIFISNVENKEVYGVTEKFLTMESKEEINRRNFIFCREKKDDFNKTIEEIRTTIHTDYEWLKYHTKLQVKALDWERHRDNSRLLRGKELREAEERIASAGTKKDPQPTDLQRQYVLNSQKNELRTRRQLIIGLSAGLIITIVLSIAAVAQRNLAIERARIARAGELAALALSDLNNHFDRALLFGVESLNLEANSRSLNSMSSLLQSRPDIIRFLSGHSSFISSIAFSPGGTTIASGSCALWERGWETSCEQGEIILWDISNLSNVTQITKLTELDTGVSKIVFSPNGKVMVSADWSGDVILWDTTHLPSTQKLSEIYDTYPAIPIAGMAISANGNILAVTQENSIFLFDITVPSSPVKLATIINPVSEETSVIPSEIIDISYDSTAGILVSVSNNGMIVFWDITSLEAPVMIASQLLGRTNCVAFNQEGTILAAGGDNQTVTLWDISLPLALKNMGKLTAHSGPVTSLVFGLDGNTLASGGADGRVILWDISDPLSAKKKDELIGHSNSVESIAISPDGRIIASGDFNKIIILWNNFSESIPLQNTKLSAHIGAVNSVAYRPDGKILASGGGDKVIKLWDVSDPSRPLVISTMTGAMNSISSLTFSPDGKFLAAGDTDFNLHLWDVSDATQPFPRSMMAGHRNIVRGIAFSPDGKLLISSGGANVFLWDISNPNFPLQVASAEAFDSSMALSPNGKILAIGDYATTLWDLSNPSQPAKLAILSGHEGASLAFSKDNKLLATGGCRYYLNSCMQGEIVIWDTSNPALPIQKSSLLLGTSKITSLAFSPDSPSLASTYSDGVMIWDISNPEAPLQQTSLSKNIETALSLAYSPDGKSLVSGDLNGTLILWNQDPNSEEGLHSWVKTACQIAGRNFTQTEWTQYFPDDEYRITCPQWPAGE